ncbi:hypothetical protein RS030_132069 [Cryptosporidium xiaoi]|uniref:Uncharacterized protein n=1 Tax=Cryptosporidium xiaoi TaxID=659607 RepID=A0AAV9Y306_9CRYT
MDEKILSSLPVEVLRGVETRISKSVVNLQCLINELKDENIRLSCQNYTVEKQIKSRKYTANSISNYVMEKFGIGVICQDGIDRTQKKEPNGVAHNSTGANKEAPITRINETNDTELKSKHKEFISDTGELVSEVEFNSGDKAESSEEGSDVTGKRARELIPPIYHGSGMRFKLIILLDAEKYVEIRFCKFSNESERDDFVGKVIGSIGLKSVYFDCIRNLVIEIEEKGSYDPFEVDIADLDPWYKEVHH